MENDHQKALNVALKSLSYSPKSSHQLSFDLRKKGFELDAIDEALSKLNEWGYIDDSDWMHMYIDAQKKRYHGPKVILKKLLDKHIPFQQANQALQSFYKEEEEIYWIRSFLDSKAPTISSHKDKSLVLRKLLQKGFHYEHIFSELSTISTTF